MAQDEWVNGLNWLPLEVPKRLFRFRSFQNINYARKELEEIEQNCRIFVSRAEDLNDPLDCSPLVDVFTKSDAKNLIVKLEKFKETCPEVNLQSLILESHLAFCKEAAFQVWSVDYIQHLFENAKKRLRVACFTADCSSTKMWNDYANKFKGVCFEFELKEECPMDIASITFSGGIGMLRDVVYSKDRPIIFPASIIVAALGRYSLPLNLMLGQPAVKEIFSKSYFVKSEYWSSENEIRLVTQRAMQHLSIDPYKVKSLILGPKYDNENLEEISSWAKRAGVSLLRSRLSDNYGVEIDR